MVYKISNTSTHNSTLHFTVTTQCYRATAVLPTLLLLGRTSYMHTYSNVVHLPLRGFRYVQV